jgi:hypothetical protein
MNIWDRQRLIEAIQEKKNKIKAMIEGGPMILFMKHKDSGDIFGADEPARVIYARMKNPDDDSPPGWADQANFMATNLCKLLNGGGEGIETVFGKKDLKKLNVIDDKDDLIDQLVNSIKGGDGSKKIVIVHKQGHEPGGIQFGNDFQEL